MAERIRQSSHLQLQVTQDADRWQTTTCVRLASKSPATPLPVSLLIPLTAVCADHVYPGARRSQVGAHCRVVIPYALAHDHPTFILFWWMKDRAVTVIYRGTSRMSALAIQSASSTEAGGDSGYRWSRVRAACTPFTLYPLAASPHPLPRSTLSALSGVHKSVVQSSDFL